MIRWPTTIYIAVAPVNLHASFDTLTGMVRGILRKEPRTDALFLFHNRRRTLVKGIWHDGSGYVVVAKRLDRGTYRIPLAIPPEATCVTATAREVAVLLEGLDPATLRTARRAGLATTGRESSQM